MNLLVIEDNESTRLIIKSAIEKMGHRVIGEATDIEEAIEKIENLEYDAVLLDILIPGGSGLELIEKINGKNKKIVVITALDEDELDKELKKKNVFDILKKPFSYEELEKIIKKL